MVSQNPADTSDDLPDDVRAAIEAAFGPGAFEMLNDDDASGVLSGPTSTESSPTSDDLESLLAEIDRSLDGPSDGLDRSTTITERRAVTTDHKYIIFELGHTLFAAPLVNVTEIQRLPHVTRLPNVPNWLRGVANLRGAVISLIDLCDIAEVDSAEQESTQRMMVVRSQHDDMVAGLIVDRILGIRPYSSDAVKPFTAPVESPLAGFLRGAARESERLVGVLDLERFLKSDSIRQFESR